LCTKRESLQKNELEEGHDRTRGGKGREREKGRKREKEKERKKERERERKKEPIQYTRYFGRLETFRLASLRA
jgi:hypothetical protein